MFLLEGTQLLPKIDDLHLPGVGECNHFIKELLHDSVFFFDIVLFLFSLFKAHLVVFDQLALKNLRLVLNLEGHVRPVEVKCARLEERVDGGWVAEKAM